MILRDRSARLSLDRSEKLDGMVVGGGFMIGLILGLIGLAIGQEVLMLTGAMFMLAAIPSSMCFVDASLKARIVFGGAAILIYLTGTIGIMGYTNITDATLVKHGAGAIIGPILITFVSTWVAMIPSMKKPDPAH